MSTRPDLRDVAIVAHVDHGKTTLVDAILQQSGAFSERDTVEKAGERVMNSGDLERERGITILTKSTAIHYTGPAVQVLGLKGGVIISVIDTPGHTDFGGEVERGLSMVNNVVLVVDASEGPFPQTRFALHKALQAHLPVIVIVNKIDRPGSYIEEVISEMTDLLLSLGEDLMNKGIDVDVGSLMDVPVVYASAEADKCSLEGPGDGQLSTKNLGPLFETILNHIPDPTYDEDMPLQVHVTSLDTSPLLDHLALLRIHDGALKKGADVGLACHNDTIQRIHISGLLATEDLERVSTDSTAPGDIVAIAGVEDIMIDESLVDLEDPRPLPFIMVDDPAISMTIGINTSPMADRVKGVKITVHQIKDRLDRELIGNASLKVLPTERPNTWEVQGRGELTLAILTEQMCHKGFELAVGKPQVVTREIDGVLSEPMERMTIDIPEEYLGAVMQLMAAREGRMETMANHGSGWIRPEFVVPARGLVDFRTRFLAEARGTGIASSISEGYAPWQDSIEQRLTGSLVAGRAGQATPYAMTNLQERGSFTVEPFSEVYEGQAVGENPRSEDMDVNICHEKKQTNTCSATADVYESLTPSRKLTFEESLELAANDEYVEVTLETMRVRKIVLDVQERFRIVARGRRANC